MKSGKNILAVVPARKGSKGIPNKNMQKIGGLSLIGHAGKVLHDLKWIDARIISTDSLPYAREAQKHHLDAPFLRPKSLSGDKVGAIETMIHAVRESESFYGKQFDIILIVEPTCPLRKGEDIKRCVEGLLKHKADSAVTVSIVDTKFHPNKVLTLQNQKLGFYSKAGKHIKSRQQLQNLYYRNGACYALKRETLMKKKLIFTGSTLGIYIERNLVNIDEPQDMELARYYFNKEKKNSKK